MAFLSENMGIKGLLQYISDYKAVMLCCIADGAYSNVLMDNHQWLLASCNLGIIERNCPYHYLLRINKSVLVNRDCIRMIDYNWCVIVIADVGMFGLSDRCRNKLKAYLRQNGFLILQK
jgi:DNA-binding LytR/AlgR family response regulator